MLLPCRHCPERLSDFDAEQRSQSHFNLYHQISFRREQLRRQCVKQIADLRIFTAFSHRLQYN